MGILFYRKNPLEQFVLILILFETTDCSEEMVDQNLPYFSTEYCTRVIQKKKK